jgi:hypothetical protein
MNLLEHAQLLERFEALARHVSVLQARIEVLEELTRQAPHLPQNAAAAPARAKAARA